MFRPTLLSLPAFLLTVHGACAGSIQFAPIVAPTEDADKREVRATRSAIIDGETHEIGFHLLARSGDKIGDNFFAMMLDQKGNPIDNGERKWSPTPDFTSLLPIGDKLFALTQFEALPANMYLSELVRDEEGNLSISATRPVDFSSIDGMWNGCSGTVTPWGTHLGAEEYPQDAREWQDAEQIEQISKRNMGMARYFGLSFGDLTIKSYREKVLPYRYGYMVEVNLAEDGTTTPTRHYAMGRASFELASVMPDQRTAYLTDDGSHTDMYRFVADKPGDLSAGQLYAMKWTQTSDENDGAATISWVDLGHADDTTIKAAVDAKVAFRDMFDTADITSDGTCPAGFTPIKADKEPECLAVKSGMEVLASRLETRRYAALMGASTEFQKMEGSVYNPQANSLYFSVSDVTAGMEPNDKAETKMGLADHIQLPKNSCGAVYELKLDDAFMGVSAAAIVSGSKLNYGSDSPYAGTECDIDRIANPDNLAFIPGYDTLFIAEDTEEGHQNDAVWAYNLQSKVLTRIATTPYGAEASAIHWYSDIHGYSYLTLAAQHPYSETDADKMLDRQDERAYLGYIGPFPPMN